MTITEICLAVAVSALTTHGLSATDSRVSTEVPDRGSANLAGELLKITPGAAASPERHDAVRRAWDLLILHRIHAPEAMPTVLSNKQTTERLRAVLAALPEDSDPVSYAALLALLGDYDAATRWLNKPVRQSFCGNASIAMAFGRDESLAYVSVLQRRYDAVTQAAVVSQHPDGELGVDVRSDRWCLLYSVAAAAHEALGDLPAARRFACKAVMLARALEPSWNYYYPDNHEMLSAIANAAQAEAVRVGAECADK